ncbi:hypothetical protein C8Q80DRAFT_331659 [Daedaleopsis nitida]|nr:hypothetical protein C8Q80DRAFT_331659 [Daedaleopsis nitida]
MIAPRAHPLQVEQRLPIGSRHVNVPTASNPPRAACIRYSTHIQCRHRCLLMKSLRRLFDAHGCSVVHPLLSQHQVIQSTHESRARPRPIRNCVTWARTPLVSRTRIAEDPFIDAGRPLDGLNLEPYRTESKDRSRCFASRPTSALTTTTFFAGSSSRCRSTSLPRSCAAHRLERSRTNADDSEQLEWITRVSATTEPPHQRTSHNVCCSTSFPLRLPSKSPYTDRKLGATAHVNPRQGEGIVSLQNVPLVLSPRRHLPHWASSTSIRSLLRPQLVNKYDHLSQHSNLSMAQADEYSSDADEDASLRTMRVQELVEQVVDHLQDDKQAVARCSLVSRGWSTRARQNLFADIALPSRLTDPPEWAAAAHPVRLSRFHLLARHRYELYRYVKSLRLFYTGVQDWPSNQGPPILPSPWSAVDLVPLFRFTSVRSLTITGIRNNTLTATLNAFLAAFPLVEEISFDPLDP